MRSYASVALCYQDILRWALRDEPKGDIHKGTDFEKLGVGFEITDPRANLIVSRKRKFNYRYMLAEMWWNLQLTRDIGVLEDVFPNVTKFVEDQPLWSRNMASWAYGPAMNNGMHAVMLELEKDRGSRRAVISLGHPYTFDNVVLGSGTPPCLTTVQWLIRENKLSQIVTMRSNDIWRGLPLDLYQFTVWHLLMAAHLECEVGSYHHHAGSLHLYSSDRNAAKSMLAEPISALYSDMPDRVDLAYIRQGDWPAHMLRDYKGEPEDKTAFGWLKSNGYGIW